ncbi:PAS domain-containing protein [Bradyrhizobium manausense]|uniref:PAS domain-containing protein n=1 Tax=Bradyrhizobium manausense TaxID=989370 RepID=UPI001BACAEE1|nr:PAS domain-containing protein [Bradyrhizobium manausense]MBR0831543.1 PAS domain-containing protein [Bradyrhizobium manausense]
MTELGPIAGWPGHLKSAVNLLLPAKAQIVLFWGPNFVALYNDAYAPTIGDKHPRALGRPAQESWTELWDDLEPLLQRVFNTGETVFAKDRPFYIERHGYPENVFFDISYSPVQSETGEVGGVLCIVSETTERVVAQAELARAQERLTQALSAAGMVGTFDWHVQSDTFYSDARFAEMFSVDPAKGEKGAPLAEYLAGIHPEDVERIAAALDHTVTTRERYAQEYRLVQKDGSTRWVEARGECLYGEDGKPDRFVGVVVDVTSQKNAQERQRLLAREADHRVKNIFANFHSMISLSARSARTPQEMAQALRGRMDALLRAKDLVRPGIMGTEHESQRTTVDALVRTVLQPYEDGSPDRIVLSGPDVSVGAKAVTGLALALHETATNAVKYGALSRPNGSIHVTWGASQDNFHLEWDETGGPVIDVTPQTRGFGSILAERSVTSELGGTIEHDWRRNGLRLTLSVPLIRLAV